MVGKSSKDLNLTFQAPKRQRLIYAGHCLHDEHTLKTVFEKRSMCDGDVHVIHLVSPPKNPTAFSDVRRRKNAQRRYMLKSLSNYKLGSSE